MIKKKLFGFLLGVFSLGLVSSVSAAELKLATFEPPKAFIASQILGAWDLGFSESCNFSRN